MKNLLTTMIFALLLTSAVFAQEMTMKKGEEMKKGEAMKEADHTEPTEEDKNAPIPTKGVLKRGAALSNAKTVSLAKVLASPAKYAGKTVKVEGVITRACKMEGCWMQLAPTTTGKAVMIKFKDHKFFVPLKSAGAMAKAEGVLEVKTLSKEEVEHLMNEDGAKFDNINADGTVTQISFIATGVELTAAKK